MSGCGAPPPHPQTKDPGPRRILLVGVTGSGTSTLARRLGQEAGLPVHLVDEEFGWLPGWVQREPGEQRQLALATAEEPAWVFDSAYSHYLRDVADRADLIVCLDYRRIISLFRLLRRSLRRIATGERVCNGNVETWPLLFSPDSILRWHVRSFTRKRKQMADLADRYGPRKVIHFRSPVRARRWVKAVKGSGRIPRP